MTRARDLREGDVIDLRELPYEIDLDEYPLVEFEMAVVDSGEEDWAIKPDGSPSGKWVVHTREQGSWAVPADFEFKVQSRVRR